MALRSRNDEQAQARGGTSRLREFDEGQRANGAMSQAHATDWPSGALGRWRRVEGKFYKWDNADNFLVRAE